MISKIVKIVFTGIGLFIVLVVMVFGHRDIPLEDLKSKYATSPSSFVYIDDMEVHFRDEGVAKDSIPIVLIHGTGSSLHTFESWTAQLKREHRVIRMDLPAFGLTGPFPDRNYSIENYVEFLKSFLSSLEIEKCILGGNSLGGGIAWSFTVAYPGMVDKLILIDASGYPSKAKSLPLAFKIARIPIANNLFTFITPRSVAKKSVENVFADKSKVTDSLIDRYFELTLREGNRQAFIDRLKMEKGSSSHENIKRIKQKTLILWGEQDKLIPVEQAYQFHDDLSNDTLIILKNVGHVPMEESPVNSLRPVISFLNN